MASSISCFFSLYLCFSIYRLRTTSLCALDFFLCNWSKASWMFWILLWRIVVFCIRNYSSFCRLDYYFSFFYSYHKFIVHSVSMSGTFDEPLSAITANVTFILGFFIATSWVSCHVWLDLTAAVFACRFLYAIFSAVSTCWLFTWTKGWVVRTCRGKKCFAGSWKAFLFSMNFSMKINLFNF